MDLDYFAFYLTRLVFNLFLLKSIIFICLYIKFFLKVLKAN